MINEGLEEVVERKEYAEKYGFYQDVSYDEFQKGLSEEVVKRISRIKDEPEWMLEKRLTALKVFFSKPMPTWGADLSGIKFDDFYYYMSPKANAESSKWENVPDDIKQTFDKLGVPEAERKFFAGAEAQFDSSVVYSHINAELEKLGVVFTDTDTAVKKYPELMKKYWGSIIPPTDNKFAALNTATWSGGSFIYVPKGVKVPMPLNAYFRINAKNSGQFERTLIIADEGADVVYLEGCFAAGARVITSKGEKRIEDIEVNDTVLTHGARYRKVYHVQERPYSGRLYKIKYYGDSIAELNVTEEHPFVAVRRTAAEYTNANWKTEWVNAKDLGKHDYLAIPIDRSENTEDIREFDMPMKSRWNTTSAKLKLHTDDDFFRLIGYYLSEGSISGGHYVGFTFNKNETEYIDDTVSLIEKYFNKRPIVQKEYKNGISIILCSTSAARFLSEHFGKGAINKHVSEWAMKESRSRQMQLIKGFWRGDGSFMYKQYGWGSKRMFRMNTISRLLARQLRDILLRLDIFASVNMAKRQGKRHDMYTVYVGGQYLQEFAEVVSFRTVVKIGSSHQQYLQLMNMLGERKLVSYSRIAGNYAFVPIKSIETSEAREVPVYNFSVEEDESYVAEGVAVHNCTAPVYASNSLHSAVVELVALEGAHIRYVTIQNWSKNVYNLVTQRAHVSKNARVEWIDANIGSKINMKYPSIFLNGEGAQGEVLSIAIAGDGQIQDSGGKIYHLAPNTTSKIISKSVSKGSGVTTFRGLLHVAKNAENVKSHVSCDALLLDEDAKTNTFPYNQINRSDAVISHEAKVGKISDDEIFYLMSRGMNEDDATAMIVLGFIDDLTKVLPVEYSLELKRLIKIDTSKGVG
ncbi:MAG: Fe-S cluster assembly protein SufB [Candidatus Micrarchaeaceae archaeon]